MILIGLGSNVEGPWGTPAETVATALERLDNGATKVVRASRLLRSKPMGHIEQPDYINAAALIETELTAAQLMRQLHDIELSADRRRTVRWGPRTLDLDLLDYDGLIVTGRGPGKGHQKPLVLPHPGIAERSFVLAPVAEIAPDWRHPVSGKSAREMLQSLPAASKEYEFVATAGEALTSDGVT